MSNRAYSTFELKSFDESTGEFEGIASTPTTDRVGDIVESMGAEFALPLPLLYQHRSSQPIGLIHYAKPTKNGIPVKGRVMKELLSIPWIQEAWTLIQSGLIRGLSIGFKPKEFEPIDPKEPWGAQRFIKWNWLELSAVTIPANAEANIQTIKSHDVYEPERAASGAIASERKPVRINHPGDTGPKPKGSKVKPIAEQIAGFEAKRAALVAANEEVMKAAADEGRTLTVDEKETYDGNAAEVKEVDEHLVRLRQHEKLQIAKATPVSGATGDSSETAGKAERSGIIMMGGSNLPKGTSFTRYAMALAATHGNKMEAIELSKRWKDSTPEVELVLRAAVAAGDTTSSGWASQLVVAQNMASEFVDLLRPMTIVGRMNGIRRVPFNVTMPRATAGSTSGWVGQGLPKPVSRMTFDQIALTYHKIATIVVLTEELVRLSNPAAEAIVRQDMLDAIAQFTDEQFIDPTIAVSGTTSPASITNGATSHSMSGTTIATITTDVSTLFADFSTANIDLASGVWVMHPRSARYLSMLRTTQDIFAFPGITQNGGTFFGIPVLTSNSVPIDTGADTYIFLINASDILLADDGGIQIDVSREASLVMDSAPSNPATSTVNLWQSNLVGLRAERYITWVRRRAAAISYLEDVSY